MQPLPRWSGPLYFSSGVVDICINCQVTEGVIRAGIRVQHGAWRDWEALCSTVHCPALPRVCSTAGAQGLLLRAGGKVCWFGLWRLPGKEGSQWR